MVSRVLGEPHDDLERGLFTSVMAPCPADREGPEEEAAWRRALAKRHAKVYADGDRPNARGRPSG